MEDVALKLKTGGEAGRGKNGIGTEMEDHVNTNARTHGDSRMKRFCLKIESTLV
jgi:hypothetical protein